MGCGLISALLGLPRIGFVAVWFLQPGYITKGLEGNTLFALLGFLFLPLTTMAFAYAMNSMGVSGEMTNTGWAITAVGFAFDVGLVARRPRKGSD